MTHTAQHRRLAVFFLTTLVAAALAIAVAFASPGSSPSAPAGTVPPAHMASIEFASASAN